MFRHVVTLFWSRYLASKYYLHLNHIKCLMLLSPWIIRCKAANSGIGLISLTTEPHTMGYGDVNPATDRTSLVGLLSAFHQQFNMMY